MNLRAIMLVAMLGVVGVLAGCGGNGAERSEAATRLATRAEVCGPLEVPIKYLEEDGLTVESVLSAQTKDAIGMRAMLALLGPWNVERAGRFQPVLRYLAKRWELESPPGARTQPQPAPTIIENAKELDRFLAGGGCD